MEEREAMTLDIVLAKLYASELNCELSSFWDVQWRVRLGDEQNGFVADSVDMLLELSEIGSWLCAEVPKHYPDSEFAEWATKLSAI